MKNINKILNNYLAGKLADLPAIYNDFFVEDLGDSVISRHDPSNAAERRFIDGGRQGLTQVSYMTRSADALKALKWADDIANTLDGLEIDDGENGVQLSITLSAAPQFVAIDDAAQKIFSTTATVDYTIEK